MQFKYTSQNDVLSLLSCSYGIRYHILGSFSRSKRIFQWQKIIIRVMTDSTSRISCRTPFWKLEKLTLTSQYILSSMRFLLSNLEIYTFITSVYNIITRLKLKQHKPIARLTMYDRSAYYNSINIYTTFLDDLTESVWNEKHFLLQQKNYLSGKTFYSLEKYMNA